MRDLAALDLEAQAFDGAHHAARGFEMDMQIVHIQQDRIRSRRPGLGFGLLIRFHEESRDHRSARTTEETCGAGAAQAAEIGLGV